MSLFEWFATVGAVGLSWVCLSFPYLFEKAIKHFGVDDE